MPFLHWKLSSVRRVCSDGFLWSTFVWQFDSAYLCVMFVKVVA